MGLGRFNVGPCCGCGEPGPTLLCGCLPPTNLTLTTTSTLFGVRTTTLVFNGTNEWANTACLNATIFGLTCNSGTLLFTSTRYVGGCFTGSALDCSSGGASPMKLTQTVRSCSPLYLEYSPSQCSSLSTQGYTKLVVTL